MSASAAGPEELAQLSGIRLARGEGKVGAPAVAPSVATALCVAEGTVLGRITFDTDDQLVEVMTAYYNFQNKYCGAGDPARLSTGRSVPNRSSADKLAH